MPKRERNIQRRTNYGGTDLALGFGATPSSRSRNEYQSLSEVISMCVYRHPIVLLTIGVMGDEAYAALKAAMSPVM